jgi:hypothetical protein
MEENYMQNYAEAVSLNAASWKTGGVKVDCILWGKGESFARECVGHNVGQKEFKMPSRPGNSYCYTK